MKGPLGYPVCRFTVGLKESEKSAMRFMQEKAEQWLREAGAIAIDKLPLVPIGLSTHAYGGTRMGNDPETNVVNAWGSPMKLQISAFSAARPWARAVRETQRGPSKPCRGALQTTSSRNGNLLPNSHAARLSAATPGVKRSCIATHKLIPGGMLPDLNHFCAGPN